MTDDQEDLVNETRDWLVDTFTDDMIDKLIFDLEVHFRSQVKIKALESEDNYDDSDCF